MTDDPTFLASAYLDGDVSADERAQVDRDPELLAEVERLRAVRVLLGEPEEPRISIREVHLAAALDAWDRLPDAERSGDKRDPTPAGLRGADVAAGAAIRSTSGRRNPQRRQAWWLTAAAAALVVVAGGAVARVALTGSDTDDAASSASAETESADAADTASDAAAEEIEGIEELEEPAALGVDEELDESARLDTSGDGPPPPPDQEAVQQLRTPQDLADFAAPAAAAPVAADVPAATSAPVEEATAPQADGIELPLCLGADIIVGPAFYGDTLVVVAIDEGRNLALAYDGDTCTEIARAELPGP